MKRIRQKLAFCLASSLTVVALAVGEPAAPPALGEPAAPPALGEPAAPPASGELSAPLPLTTADGFRVPQAHAPLSFPRDHGSHPDFKIEWWYLTGQLSAPDGRRFGYQATFFRQAAPLPAANGNPAFGDAQFFFAHAALSDLGRGEFHHQQRGNRDGWDAFSATGQLDLRNGNWSLRMSDPQTGTMQLHTSIGSEIELTLELTPRKPLIRFGADGLSRKGSDPLATSYYLTFSRIESRGTLRTAAGTTRVEGTSWMDHEIASNQLSPELAGWDWTAIHLADGREIKAYILRRNDGTPDPFSRLIWIGPNNELTYHDTSQFTWTPQRWWTSPTTGARYPIEVLVRTTDPANHSPVEFLIQPLLDPQELTGPVSYWEGACKVLDPMTRTTIGHAYLELAGYAKPLTKALR